MKKPLAALAATLALLAGGQAGAAVPSPDGAHWTVPAGETLISAPSLGFGKWSIGLEGGLAAYTDDALMSVGIFGSRSLLFTNKSPLGSIVVNNTSLTESLRFWLHVVNTGQTYSDLGHNAKWTQIGPSSFRLYWEDLNLRHSDKDYNDLVMNISAVPEPETYAMMLAGIGILGAIGRRRRRNA